MEVGKARCSMFIASAVACVFVMIAGIVLVALARCSRADAVYPRCVSCGYDVGGLESATVCSECGADLTAPRAIAVAERTRIDRRRMWAGLLLIVIGFAGLVMRMS